MESFIQSPNNICCPEILLLFIPQYFINIFRSKLTVLKAKCYAGEQ